MPRLRSLSGRTRIEALIEDSALTYIKAWLYQQQRQHLGTVLNVQNVQMFLIELSPFLHLPPQTPNSFEPVECKRRSTAFPSFSLKVGGDLEQGSEAQPTANLLSPERPYLLHCFLPLSIPSTPFPHPTVSPPF